MGSENKNWQDKKIGKNYNFAELVNRPYWIIEITGELAGLNDCQEERISKTGELPGLQN